MFKRWWSRERPKTVIREPTISGVAQARIEAEFGGRLTGDVIHGETMSEPAPEYIQETVEPSEAAWAREEELYRKKQQES